MRLVSVIAAAAASLALAGAWQGPLAQSPDTARHRDRHAGYYYPIPQTSETYKARAVTLPEANRQRRLAFVTALTTRMMSNPYPPPFIMFAKGSEAEKLIIVGVEADSYNTLYRGRALLAMLTSLARTTPIFQEFGVEDTFTFFDLAKLLGFRKITISDGDRYAHQIFIE